MALLLNFYHTCQLIFIHFHVIFAMCLSVLARFFRFKHPVLGMQGKTASLLTL